MKKTLSVILAAIVAVPAVCLPVSAHANHVNDGDTLSFNGATATNAFGDLLDWNGVVFGDANNIIDLEGSLAVGGSFSSPRGLSVNGGAYGSQNLTTEDVAFLVNGNVNISGYGSVWGQTVVGNADGNTYHLSNVTPSATTNGQFAVADSSRYFADAKNTAYAVKAAVDALPVNGVCHAAYGTYTFVGDADAKTLVYNVDDANISSYIFDFTIAEGQTVVVNFTTSDTLRFKYGAVRINGKSDQQYLRQFNRNIILNVVSADKIEMTGCELYGTLLAPDAEMIGNDANVCGTSILNGLTGNGGFELHVGYNNSFIPAVSASTPDPVVPADPEDPTDPEEPTDPAEVLPTAGNIRIDVPLKMAVVFADGTVYYGGEMKEVVFNQEYTFQMCSVNWDNGVYDENGNGLRGSVVYRMIVVHKDEFNRRAQEAKQDPDRYTVKGIDIIDNVGKIIIINGDAKDAHLETDVNNFFMAYRFHFTGQDYNKKTGIAGVINTPIESLSVNLPLGSTIACDAYVEGAKVDSANVFIEHNSGKGVYNDVYLTSVNDYTWNH